MARSRTHTSAKAADVAKLLLLNEHPVNTILSRRVRRCLHLTLTLTNPNPNANDNVTLSGLSAISSGLILSRLRCHLSTESCKNRLSSFRVILQTNKQTNKQIPMKT